MPTKSPIPQSSPFEQTPSAQNVNEFTSPPFYEFQQTPLAQTVDDQYFDQMLEVLPNNEYQSGKNTSGEDSGLLRPVFHDVQQMNPQLPEEQPHQEQQNNAEEEAPNYMGEFGNLQLFGLKPSPDNLIWPKDGDPPAFVSADFA
jgi:hypothetical protein